MKKLLLSCFLVLGVSAFAQQTIFSDNFESSTSGTYGSWTSGYFGSVTSPPAARNDFMVRTSTECATGSVDGSGKHLQIVRYAANVFSDCTYAGQTAAYKPLVYKTIDAKQYKNIILSFDWVGVGQASTDYGQLVIAPKGGSSFYTAIDKLGLSATKKHVEVNLTELFDGVADINFTDISIGFAFVANNSTHNGPGFSVDNIVVTGEKPTVAPGCTTFVGLLNGDTVNAGTLTFNWNPEPNASSYKIMVGTTSGASDVYLGTTTDLSASVPLGKSKTYFAKVVPTNSVGDAVNCSSIEFSTNNTIAYCTPTISGTPDEVISKVVFAGIDNTSTGTAGYQDFTALTPAVVLKGAGYPITVTVGPNYSLNQTVVWIDYNQDGAFTDDEKTILSGTASATGTVNIPDNVNVKEGNTRMRVRLHYNSPTITLSACGATVDGQTEDYTVEIKTVPAGTSNVDKSNVSVYPNPFQDVLKISDVKGVKSISVSDVSGKQVKNMKPSTELNLSDLKTGMYIVTLNMEDGTVKTFKTIKK